jgi:hypothetical protein
MSEEKKRKSQTCLRKINIHINNPPTCGLILHLFASNRLEIGMRNIYLSFITIKQVRGLLILYLFALNRYEEHISFFYHHQMGVKQV